MTLRTDAPIIARGQPGDWDGQLLPHVSGRPGLIATPLCAMWRDGSLDRWLDAEVDGVNVTSQEQTSASWLYLLRPEGWLDIYRADHPGWWRAIQRQQVLEPGG